ncbi:hypothetical protein QBC47DRAFT_377782 [Echria macrotheca]|uniref:YCII-related domain-containing protein n=1 Tax=Echria macrotheca TaxID=438768 RepID=A0AAJ0F7H3_9PEZI|nr:hypothetical protein QBC47DRAFT_377782 [Echria macrotheca]
MATAASPRHFPRILFSARLPILRTPTRPFLSNHNLIVPRNNNNITASPRTTTRRTMATSTGRKYEWLVVVPDFPGTLAKRLEVRPTHFAGLKPRLDSGQFQMGGSILDEVPQDDEPTSLKMNGSSLVVVAESKAEILDILRDDIYAKSGVWDVDNGKK